VGPGFPITMAGRGWTRMPPGKDAVSDGVEILITVGVGFNLPPK